MSKIGQLPVKFDSNVKVNVEDGGDYNYLLVTVAGPKGQLKLSLRKGVKVSVTENEVIVEKKSDTKAGKAYHGLYRSLIANMVEGVTKGFEKKLEIHGTGYRGELKSPQQIELKLGFSHSVNYKAREGIELSMDDQNTITVRGIDKHLVGQTAAEIRELRKPEPYKGKGIRYADEQVKRKSGKSGATA